MGKILNIPNLLTFSRVAMIPVFFMVFTWGWYLAAALILAYSFLSDYFDGKVARKLKQCTHFGAVLDPVADKCMVLAYYGLILAEGWGPTWFCLLLFTRNVAQLAAIPILSWWLRRDFKVKPKWQPKWASAVAFALIPILILTGRFHLASLTPLAELLIVVSTFLELYVLVTYVPRLVQIAMGRHDTFE